jgi:hypothetical protein
MARGATPNPRRARRKRCDAGPTTGVTRQPSTTWPQLANHHQGNEREGCRAPVRAGQHPTAPYQSRLRWCAEPRQIRNAHAVSAAMPIPPPAPCANLRRPGHSWPKPPPRPRVGGCRVSVRAGRHPTAPYQSRLRWCADLLARSDSDAGGQTATRAATDMERLARTATKVRTNGELPRTRPCR